MKLPALFFSLIALALSGCIVVIEAPQKKDGAKAEAGKALTDNTQK
ncbi:MAG: hypothetical protein JHC77_00280 [Opitutales bacterium]|nr:hypothetical protein [Opitutales bacterium]